jgi:NADH-quinone oxidoreductase subunit E
MLSDQEKTEIEEHLREYPYKQAACIEALKVVQKHRRWISDEGVKDIAGILEMSPDEVDSVATFYNLIYRKPVGRHVILLCDSVSCWVMGYEKILEYFGEKYGIGFGQTTSDDRFTLLPVPCLGTCDHAPALMIDNDLHRDLNLETLASILEKYK